MKRVSYTVFLTETDVKKILFDEHRGRVLHFVVHYYGLIDGRWRSIIRFDTSHGYAHRHTFHRDGREYVVDLSGEYDILLTEAIESVTEDFEDLKENYFG